MRILVTGACGYIGQGLVSQLLKDGAEVIATDIADEFIGEKHERLHYISAELFSVRDPYHFFEEPEVCFHLAWRNGFVHNNPSHILDLPGHYSFLSRLCEDGIQQMIVMGSMHEIGFYEGSIKADTPANPQSLYGIAKNALRQSIELLCEQRQVVFQWVRGYYIVGNSTHGCSVFSKITAAERRGDASFPFTMGQNQWDFTDYDLFCEMLASIAEQDKYTGIINACSGFPEKLKDRVERFLLENGYRIRLDYGAFPDRPYDSKAVWGDDSIIRKIMQERKNGSAAAEV